MNLGRNVTAAALMYLELAGASSSNAATLFQSVPDLTANPVISSWCSPCDGRFRAFDTFSLAAASIVGSVAFTVQTDFFFPTDVDISIWTVIGGRPGAQLLDHTFSPDEFVSLANTSHDTSVVTVNPLAWSLAAGTYDISIFGIDGNLGVPGYSGGSGLLFLGVGLLDTGDPDSFVDGESAGFALFSDAAVAAPLPAALPLFTIGLGALYLLGWRRKRMALALTA